VSAADTCSPLQAEIDAKASRAPRVTLDEIEAEIEAEHYFTAEEGFVGILAIRNAQGMQPGDTATVRVAIDVPDVLALITICVLVLKNGHRSVGVNEGPVSAANFDAQVGRKMARQKAIDQLWPLLGFRLRDRLAEFRPPASVDLALRPHQQRVLYEHQDLCQRVHRLQAFLGTATFGAQPEAEQLRLRQQAEHMASYEQVLRERIAAFSAA
jgi:hypothetical protein